MIFVSRYPGRSKYRNTSKQTRTFVDLKRLVSWLLTGKCRAELENTPRSAKISEFNFLTRPIPGDKVLFTPILTGGKPKVDEDGSSWCRKSCVFTNRVQG